ncbi:hypothetical protein EJ06DRAFT_467410, partial [Trichodelitschia bisporula]
SNQPSSISALGGLTAELDKLSPRFEIDASQIEILKTPSEFYEVLKFKISHAKRRIFLSTLYIGKTEHELISTLHAALKRNPDLKLSILTDALRGTRESPNPSCASLLAPLISEFGPRVEIRMFHTPNLTGIRKALVPKRINEGWGLQHMKLYGIDDELIMSGANLSDDYFTNRQDRYHVFSSAAVTAYFARVHHAVSSLSFQVHPSPTEAGYTLTWPSTNPSPSPLSNPHAFRTAATHELTPLLHPPAPPTASKSQTLLYPLLQFTPVLTPDSSTELPALTALLTSLRAPPFGPSSRWTFTAGYFNMTPSFRDMLLSSRPGRATVIAAAPEANGFFNSGGVSGLLPAAYTHLSRKFVEAASAAGLASNITLKEWRRGTVGTPGGWTYHAKGIWAWLPGEAGDAGPSVSVVGSSNFTARSYGLDLEAGVCVVTADEGLRKRLAGEVEHLESWAEPVGEFEFERVERRVGPHVRLAMWIVKVLGGAL